MVVLNIKFLILLKNNLKFLANNFLKQNLHLVTKYLIYIIFIFSIFIYLHCQIKYFGKISIICKNYIFLHLKNQK